ncbi:MAG: IS110 family transposase [Pseudomonadota bacterium]
MDKITTIGIDLAKDVFQVHGIDVGGRVIQRRQLRRSQVRAYFADLQPCLVGMEACAGAHFWARELIALGHEVRLMPPSYVKPYVKRGKTDAADAAAICEAATRPSMRFVPVKTAEQQAVLVAHNTRDFLVRQLTQIGNSIRAHLGEFGLVAPKGVHNVETLVRAEEEDVLPAAAKEPLRLLGAQFRETKARVDEITRTIDAARKSDPVAKRLATIPGVGTLTSSVIAATVPEVSNFRTARDLSAWLGLTPKSHSSGGKEHLGRISKMGNRYIRRLLYLGAMAQISARRKRGPGEDWLWNMLQRKPVKLVAIALANRMARTIWALLKTGESYKARVA